MPSEDLERLNKLHLEIRKEAHSAGRNQEHLWDLVERVAQELLILRAQVEGKRIFRLSSSRTNVEYSRDGPEKQV